MSRVEEGEEGVFDFWSFPFFLGKGVGGLPVQAYQLIDPKAQQFFLHHRETALRPNGCIPALRLNLRFRASPRGISLYGESNGYPILRRLWRYAPSVC
jgi:hypothetical protein